MYQQISLFSIMEDLSVQNDTYDEIDEFNDNAEDEGIVSIGRKIDFDRSERRIRDLHNDYQVGDLDPSPFFRRGYVWNLKKASLLIESILLNVPIPLIYTAEEDVSGIELVIDGQQRLTSLFNFLTNNFVLTGLKVFKELNGKNYKELDRQYQRKIDRYQLSVVKVSADSDEEVKFEIFERINSGSVNLNEQELRNCIYRGYYTEFLKECSKEPLLIELAFSSFLPSKHKSQANIETAMPKRMENVEIVLRFFTLYKESLAS